MLRHTAEAAVLSVFVPCSVAQLGLPDERTMGHLLGPYSGLVITLLMLAFFVGINKRQARKLDETNERRHQETLAASKDASAAGKENAAELKALCVDVAGVAIKATVAAERVAEKLEHLDTAAAATEKLLLSRWCLLKCNPMLRSIMEKLIVEIPEDAAEIPPSPSSRPNP